MRKTIEKFFFIVAERFTRHDALLNADIAEDHQQKNKSTGASEMKQYHLANILLLVFTTSFIISAVFFLTLKSDALITDRPELTSPPITFDWDIATISLIITAIGTFFAIIFRWRADIRNSQRAKEQAQKNELRFTTLEDEIKRIKAKLE